MWSGLTFGLLGAIAAGALWVRLNTVSRKLANFKKSSQLLAEQRAVLELIAKDAEFKVVLDSLTQAVGRLTGHCLCAVFLVDQQQGHLVEGSGGALPSDYLKTVYGASIGHDSSACGLAAASNQTVIAENLPADTRFQPERALAAHSGLRSCLCVPIHDSQGTVVGVLSIYGH